MMVVLFLCTGNYYRSRFAEELFNHSADRAGIAWTATSRALAIERGIRNVGPLSRYVLQALGARGIAARSSKRMPQPCSVHDMQNADLIVALMEAEHRPLIFERFPDWVDKAEYWNVGDIDVAHPDAALNAVSDHVATLIQRLSH
ncbi:MAG: low molecular weight phosphatase family protein [Xanthobacteraceae bacterium]